MKEKTIKESEVKWPKWICGAGPGITNKFPWISTRLMLSLIPMLSYVALPSFFKLLPEKFIPKIDVNGLPAFEYELFHGFLHRWMSQFINPVFDILAATLYIIHYSLPLALSLYLWWKYRDPKRIAYLVWCLGLVNTVGVLIQLVIPTSPPWFWEKCIDSGTIGSFLIKGDPAGLQRVDNLINYPLFANIYSKSNIVFGSFPSLHFAWPFFWIFYENRRSIWLWAYSILLGLSAVYLWHHFVLDLIGGILIDLLVFCFYPPPPSSSSYSSSKDPLFSSNIHPSINFSLSSDDISSDQEWNFSELILPNSNQRLTNVSNVYQV
eukprot:Anaeramoba_ignava/a353892_106.p1 GENE.a353892_106~~a353892_106.p1  ORF type:complete len:322 (+),score=57.58 a353892_106:51-1016(+)